MQQKIEAKSLFQSLSKESLTFFFYFKKTKKCLLKQGWDCRTKNNVTFKFNFTSHFQYNYNSYVLMQKAYKRIGWHIKMIRFAKIMDTNEYEYYWEISKV